MGRGRTTTGMVTACLISSTINWQENGNNTLADDDLMMYGAIDGLSEEEVYFTGE